MKPVTKASWLACIGKGWHPLSTKTCEECGQPGTLRGGGWIVTRCDAHAGGRQPWSTDEP